MTSPTTQAEERTSRRRYLIVKVAVDSDKNDRTKHEEMIRAPDRAGDRLRKSPATP